MPRFLRYFLIWLCCTALTATVVMLTVGFVVGSTAPLPPTARGVSTLSATATPPAAIGTPASTPVAPTPTPTHRQQPSRTAAPPSHPAAPTRRPDPADCTGGAGAHSVQSVGGQVTVRFGADAVCLVSAVPGLGYTTSTAQSAPDTLTVTFTGAHHRSEVTASLHPQAQVVTREVSW